MLRNFVNLLAPITLSLYLLSMLLRFGRWFMVVRYPRLRRKGLFQFRGTARRQAAGWTERRPGLLTTNLAAWYTAVAWTPGRRCD